MEIPRQLLALSKPGAGPWTLLSWQGLSVVLLFLRGGLIPAAAVQVDLQLLSCVLACLCMTLLAGFCLDLPPVLDSLVREQMNKTVRLFPRLSSS